MGRNIIATMEKIFDVLEQRVDINDKHRIVKISRHIVADCEEPPVVKFVDSSKLKIVKFNMFSLIAFEFLDTKYILIPSDYENVLEPVHTSASTIIAKYTTAMKEVSNLS